MDAIVIKTPRGELPESLRAAWVGVRLFVDPYYGGASGILTLKPAPDDGQQLWQTDKLEALAELARFKRTEANQIAALVRSSPCRYFIMRGDELFFIGETELAWG